MKRFLYTKPVLCIALVYRKQCSVRAWKVHPVHQTSVVHRFGVQIVAQRVRKESASCTLNQSGAVLWCTKSNTEDEKGEHFLYPKPV